MKIHWKCGAGGIKFLGKVGAELAHPRTQEHVGAQRNIRVKRVKTETDVCDVNVLIETNMSPPDSMLFLFPEMSLVKRHQQCILIGYRGKFSICLFQFWREVYCSFWLDSVASSVGLTGSGSGCHLFLSDTFWYLVLQFGKLYKWSPKPSFLLYTYILDLWICTRRLSNINMGLISAD